MIGHKECRIKDDSKGECVLEKFVYDGVGWHEKKGVRDLGNLSWKLFGLIK